MAGLKSALVFLLQSIVVGLAVAFVVVLVRPDLMPGISGGDPPVSREFQATARRGDTGRL